MTTRSRTASIRSRPDRAGPDGRRAGGALGALLPPLGAVLGLLVAAFWFGRQPRAEVDAVRPHGFPAGAGREMTTGEAGACDVGAAAGVAGRTRQAAPVAAEGAAIETAAASSPARGWRSEFSDPDMPPMDPSWSPMQTRRAYLEHRLKTLREAAGAANQLRRAEQLELLSLGVILDQAGLSEVCGEGTRVKLSPRFRDERVFIVNEGVYRYDRNEFPETVLLERATRELSMLVAGDFQAEDRGLIVDWQVPEELLIAVENRCIEALGFLEDHPPSHR